MNPLPNQRPSPPEARFSRPADRGSRWLGGLVAAVGLATVATFLVRAQTPSGAPNPAGPATAPDGAPPVTLPALPVVPRPPAQQPPVGLDTDTHLDKTPPRQTKGLDLVKLGWTYNCMECHKLFPARWHYDRPMNEHRDIVLDHGNNRFCLNCHHPRNRSAFVDYDGSEIAQSDVVQMCAKCHGPTHRDWEAGVHGRPNGHWDATRGPKTKLRCIQCHDPHRPKFAPVTPLPSLAYPPRAANPPAKGVPAAPGTGH